MFFLLAFQISFLHYFTISSKIKFKNTLKKSISFYTFRLQMYNTFSRNFQNFDERTKIGDERILPKTHVTPYGRMIALFFAQKMILTNVKNKG